MPLWKATLSYDGTHLHGWQVQPKLSTVQGQLAEALARVTGHGSLPQGAGRTDAGVHALGQVASFEVPTPIPSQNLQRALNRVLPESIRVVSLTLAEPSFHARHSARAKTYEYRIFPRRALPRAGLTTEVCEDSPQENVCPPILAPYVWACPHALRLPSLEGAAAQILGQHDFTSFAASGSDVLNPERQPAIPRQIVPNHPTTPPSAIRTIFHSAWHVSAGGLLHYRITGSGFLHHMVRNLVGTFVLCGSGKLAPEQIPAILEARRRSAAGPTAPARGLFLAEVHYA